MSSLACRRPPQKSIPLDAFGTRGSGKAAPLRWLHPRALGASRGFVALATPPFPLPPPWRLPAKHHVPLRAVHAHSAEDVQRGARKLLSEMHAQFLREEVMAPLRRSGGARQRASSRLRSVAAPATRFAAPTGVLRTAAVRCTSTVSDPVVASVF